MEKYFVTLYQVVKDTKTVREKISNYGGGDVRTYHNDHPYRAFHINAFARDLSGRKLIGKFKEKFSEKEWTLSMVQVHLFCKKIVDTGSFTSKDIEFDTLFPNRQGSNLLYDLCEQLKKNNRVILTEGWEVSEFGAHSGNDNLTKAFTSRKFSARKHDLPKDSFIVIDIEEPEL